MEDVKLVGKVSISARMFNAKSGEITFISNIFSVEEYYRDLPFLRLSIERGDEEDPVEVDDEYSSFIPYLKQLPGFRKYFPSLIGLAMQMPEISECDLFEEGLQSYAQKLSTYSNTRAIISQAKAAVGLLRSEKPEAEKLARAVLVAMGRIPVTDIKFIA
jgi:hypothetical protein